MTVHDTVSPQNSKIIPSVSHIGNIFHAKKTNGMKKVASSHLIKQKQQSSPVFKKNLLEAPPVKLTEMPASSNLMSKEEKVKKSSKMQNFEMMQKNFDSKLKQANIRYQFNDVDLVDQSQDIKVNKPNQAIKCNTHFPDKAQSLKKHLYLTSLNKVKPQDNSMLAKSEVIITIHSLDDEESQHSDEIKSTDAFGDDKVTVVDEDASLPQQHVMQQAKFKRVEGKEVRSYFYQDETQHYSANSNNQQNLETLKSEFTGVKNNAAISYRRTQTVQEVNNLFIPKMGIKSNFSEEEQFLENATLTNEDQQVAQKPGLGIENQSSTKLKSSKLSLRLQNLKVLSLSYLMNNAHVSHLDLRNNRLKKIPNEICDMPLLSEIKLDYNFLTQLPYGLHRLKNLTLLSASQNLLKSLPKTLFEGNLKLEHLQFNDNKLSKLTSKIGSLMNLKSLMLQNNTIYALPVSLYKLSKLEELGLDWFTYLTMDQQEISQPMKILSWKYCLSSPTKVIRLKHSTGKESRKKENEISTNCALAVVTDPLEDSNDRDTQSLILNTFLSLCKFLKIQNLEREVERVKEKNMHNPQQDDQIVVMRNGPAIQAYDGTSRPVGQVKRLNFLTFLMFFYGVSDVDTLIMKKTFHMQKQRKLSHIMALNGHRYLLKHIIHELTKFKKDTTLYQLLNSLDKDFSTPIVLALKNKRQPIVKLLLDNPRTCLKQGSMRFGTPLHVALSNKEFQNAIKILKIMSKQPDFMALSDLNKVDEDGNTPLHIVLKNFGHEVTKAIKIAKTLLKFKVDLHLRNHQDMTPLNYCSFYNQTEAVRFAIEYNKNQAKSGVTDPKNLFNFNETGGKYQFSCLHHAVFQNNLSLIVLLLTQCPQLNQNVRDIEDRRPHDLCFQISAIFKMLRKQHNSKRGEVLIQHLIDRRGKLSSGELKHNSISIKFKSQIQPIKTHLRDFSIKDQLNYNLTLKQSDKQMMILTTRGPPTSGMHTSRLNSPKWDLKFENPQNTQRREKSVENAFFAPRTEFLSINQIIQQNYRPPVSPCGLSDRDVDLSAAGRTSSLNQIHSVSKRKITLTANQSLILNSTYKNHAKQVVISDKESFSEPSHIALNLNSNPFKRKLQVKKEIILKQEEESSEVESPRPQYLDEDNLVNRQMSIRSQSLMSQISKIHNLEKAYLNQSQENLGHTERSNLSTDNISKYIARDETSLSSGVNSGGTRQKEQSVSSNDESSEQSFSAQKELKILMSQVNVFHSKPQMLKKHLLKYYGCQHSHLNDLMLAQNISENLQGTGKKVQKQQIRMSDLNKSLTDRKTIQNCDDEADSLYNVDLSDNHDTQSENLGSTLENKMKQIAASNKKKSTKINHQIIYIKDENQSSNFNLSADGDTNLHLATIRQEDFIQSNLPLEIGKVLCQPRPQNKVHLDSATFDKFEYQSDLSVVENEDAAEKPLVISKQLQNLYCNNECQDVYELVARIKRLQVGESVNKVELKSNERVLVSQFIDQCYQSLYSKAQTVHHLNKLLSLQFSLDQVKAAHPLLTQFHETLKDVVRQMQQRDKKFKIQHNVNNNHQLYQAIRSNTLQAQKPQYQSFQVPEILENPSAGLK